MGRFRWTVPRSRDGMAGTKVLRPERTLAGVRQGRPHLPESLGRSLQDAAPDEAVFLKAQERRRIPLSSHLLSTSTSEAENNGCVISVSDVGGGSVGTGEPLSREGPAQGPSTGWPGQPSLWLREPRQSPGTRASLWGPQSE